jgi:hypothetical protein
MRKVSIWLNGNALAIVWSRSEIGSGEQARDVRLANLG